MPGLFRPGTQDKGKIVPWEEPLHDSRAQGGYPSLDAADPTAFAFGNMPAR